MLPRRLYLSHFRRLRRKTSLWLGIGSVFCTLSFVTATEPASDLPLSSKDRILILAPHPDDEVLCCGGLIQEAAAKHLPIKIVFLTYGDYDKWAFSIYRHSPVFRPKTMRAMGEVRRAEALAAAQVLGVTPDALTFLGYPDYETLTIWDEHWSESSPYESRNTRVHAVPYQTAYRPQAAYKGEEILHDIEAAVKTFQPTKVFVPHPADRNVDHRALYFFLRVALHDLAKQEMMTYTYLIHFPKWPGLKGFQPAQTIDAPSSVAGNTAWENFRLSDSQIKLKYEALKKHRTQWGYSERFLTSFVRSNELFDIDGTQAPTDSSDFEDWQVNVEKGNLLFSGRLSKKHRTSTECRVAAYGYRRDTPFGKMPKIQVTFKNLRVLVYDQRRQILNSDVSVTRENRHFLVRIPLTLLNQPNTIFAGYEVSREETPFSWKFSRILELN